LRFKADAQTAMHSVETLTAPSHIPVKTSLATKSDVKFSDELPCSKNRS